MWNLPPRNPAFTGRQELLAALRQRLSSGDRAWVQALRGMGGVGKTQLAIEYAYLFAGEYELVWWVDAERAELIGEQVADLATQAGWAEPDTPTARSGQLAFQRLRTEPRWLMIFDNAADPAGPRDWLPQGPGHVIITSRSGGFDQLAAPVEVDVLTRAESTSMLRTRLPMLTSVDADRLAGALGDLPLALEQAIGLLATTGMTAADYLTELDSHAGQLLSHRRPVSYPASLAAAIELSVDRLGGEDDAAVQLLHLCASLAPEPIPVSWLGAAAGVLPQPLATVAGETLDLRLALGRLGDRGLARLTDDTIQLHRLTQAVVRDQRTAEQRQHDRRRVEQLLAAAKPDNDGTDPESWPAWAGLLPHLLFLDPAVAGEALRNAASSALWYLLMRGEYQTALPHARRWYEQWRTALGPDDLHTLRAANKLALALRELGELVEARDLDHDTLTRYRRMLGDDHPHALASANNLANDLHMLGEVEQARDLNHDTLTRRRRLLGDDHPDTLTSANNLANDLRLLGEVEQARDLHHDTLTRYRRMLGDDHPDTLRTANNLANDLHMLGEVEQARDLHHDTLTRRRRLLGDDHPDTLRTASNLAIDLHMLGEVEQARDLHHDTLTRRRLLGDDHPDTRATAELLERLAEGGEP